MEKNKGKNLGKHKNSPVPSDYDLIRSLTAIRKGESVVYDPLEGTRTTRTDVRIGSVNYNIWTNTEAGSGADSQFTDQYATEQYVQSLVNNIEAAQTTKSNHLIELFNGKIDAQNSKIEAIKEKCLSKTGFWTGGGIFIAVIALVVSFMLYDFQEHNKRLDNVSNSIKTSNEEIERVSNRIDSLGILVLETRKRMEALHNVKRETERSK